MNDGTKNVWNFYGILLDVLCLELLSLVSLFNLTRCDESPEKHLEDSTEYIYNKPAMEPEAHLEGSSTVTITAPQHELHKNKSV